jgi:hypothetical protein
MALLAVLPVPLWFVLALVADPGPGWRARYFGNDGLSGPAVVESERRVSRYWDMRSPTVVDGIDARRFSARWDTCLRIDRDREVTVMLVARGLARLLLDGKQVLITHGEKKRRSSGGSIPLSAGVHHLEVSFVAHGWPGVALLASFNGEVPQPIEGARLAQPEEGPDPCAHAR